MRAVNNASGYEGVDFLGSLWQGLGDTYAANKSYTLSTAVAPQVALSGLTLQVELYAGSDPTANIVASQTLSANSSSLSTSTFTDVSISTGGAVASAYVGQTIGIGYAMTGIPNGYAADIFLDNVPPYLIDHSGTR